MVRASTVGVYHHLTEESFRGGHDQSQEARGLHHLAFRAASRAEVDRLHTELRQIGATIVSPPREYPEYTPPGYYAVFFKDLEGIKYEIVCFGQNEE